MNSNSFFKNKAVLTGLAVLVVLSLVAWWLLARSSSSSGDGAARKVLYYQSPMHPWVKSDGPGNCTVCGMQLVPVYAGDSAAAGPATDIVMLPAGAPNVTGVKTVEVQRRPLSRSLRVAGMIEDDDSKHRVLSAFTGGRIEKLFVNYEGAEVKEGEPIAVFYSNDLLAAIREYKVSFAEGPSPRLTATRMRLEQLGLSPDQIAKAHQRSESDVFIDILAPISGTVVKRYVYEGQYVKEGERLFEMADFSTMWFQFVAYEQDLPLLKIGQKVTVSTPALPEKVFTAEIKFINPNLDDATRSARVRVEIANPERVLRHKLYAEGVVQIEAPEVVAVPRTAVIWPGDNPRVYVEQEPGAYQQRRVILGRPGDDFWEILEGVKEGERVVTSGNMLIDGQAQLSNIAAPEEKAPMSSDPAMAMDKAQHDELEKFLRKVAEASAILAADDLVGFNTAWAELPPAPPTFTPELTRQAGPFADLLGARRAFLPVSEAVADYAVRVRGHFPALKVFRCPMSNEAGEGIPNNAKWIQFTESLRNPFMGREMLECGTEVK